LSVFVDTSVWSLALRRDAPPGLPEVTELRRLLDSGSVCCSGLVLQELLQGFSKPKAHQQIVEHFAALPLIIPHRDDYVSAAELRNRCRRKGIQIGTVDALLAQLCVQHDLTMLTADRDFHNIAAVVSLSVWVSP
jgi:predicted nucleic acid-binding protein